LARNLDILTSKLADAAGQLPYLPRALRLVWAAARRWMALWLVLLAAQGLLPVATVYLAKGVVDRLVTAVRGGGQWQASREVLILVAALAAVLALGEILKAAAGYIRAAQTELVQDHIRGLIHRKSVQVDLAFYESPEFYDRLHRAREESSSRPVQLVENLGTLMQNGITLVAMAIVLARFGWWIPVLLAAGTAPALFVVLRYSLRQHLWRRRSTPLERRTWYYDWILTDGANACEVRLFHLGERFHRLYQDLRARLRFERLALARAYSLMEFSAGAAGLAVTGVTLAWMVWRTSRGLATLGELTLFYQAFQQGMGLARALLEGVGQLYYNLLFLGNLFEFLALEPRVLRPAAPLPAPERPAQGIRFRNVSFRYADARAPALENFNLEIPAGQVAAVVGENGAGKTTLLKLLCRFYDPEEGVVELDGVDLRRFDPAELRGRIAVLFQEPVHYHEIIRDNVALGDAAAQAEPDRVAAAAQAAGADGFIQRLPRGYDTLLGKWFADGIELSVGEWQRIALARAFYRRAGILVLDEPTSAMDPWAEADWLKRFRSLAEGRTSLIITHRFATAMYADSIHVMSRGRIVESGSHAALLALGGRYAAGWNAQHTGR
jgi:ATP-binding cassette subfamily B protein